MVRCTLLKESYYNTFLSLQITFIQLLIVLHVIKTLYVIVNNSFFFFGKNGFDSGNDSGR